MMLKPGVELLRETVGDGPPVRRHHHYQVGFHMWLQGGEPVRWPKSPSLPPDEDEATLITDVWVDRHSGSRHAFRTSRIELLADA